MADAAQPTKVAWKSRRVQAGASLLGFGAYLAEMDPGEIDVWFDQLKAGTHAALDAFKQFWGVGLALFGAQRAGSTFLRPDSAKLALKTPPKEET